jgi:hypothetical protein
LRGFFVLCNVELQKEYQTHNVKVLLEKQNAVTKEKIGRLLSNNQIKK